MERCAVRPSLESSAPSQTSSSAARWCGGQKSTCKGLVALLPSYGRATADGGRGCPLSQVTEACPVFPKDGSFSVEHSFGEKYGSSEARSKLAGDPRAPAPQPAADSDPRHQVDTGHGRSVKRRSSRRRREGHGRTAGPIYLIVVSPNDARSQDRRAPTMAGGSLMTPAATMNPSVSQ